MKEVFITFFMIIFIFYIIIIIFSIFFEANSAPSVARVLLSYGLYRNGYGIFYVLLYLLKMTLYNYITINITS